MIKIRLQGKLKTITEQKFFGTYYHLLTRHVAEQYRLFSGLSTNTEKEEATFNKIRVFTNHTSNHHPENLILNAAIRLNQKSISKESNLSHIYRPINTIIPFDWIEKCAFQYQSMLKRTADYLLN